MTCACLIIDDTRICPTYGCLNYADLLENMKRHNFFTEIAYIPWNYRLAHSKTVRLIADNPDYFGICVHGFNHTSNEFGGTDYQRLCNLSAGALWRMEQFKQRTGLGYDAIMVFPQGKFSSVAMKALKSAGYQAAFNSDIRSTDGVDPPPTEYEKPFTDIFELPMFLRRYPTDREGILSDFKNGRPIILVEHHHAFKSNELFECIDWVNSLGNIKWRSLGSVASKYCGPPIERFPQKYSMPLKAAATSALRRCACEIRDNLVAPSTVLSKIYSSIKSH